MFKLKTLISIFKMKYLFSVRQHTHVFRKQNKMIVEISLAVESIKFKVREHFLHIKHFHLIMKWVIFHLLQLSLYIRKVNRHL